MHIYEIWKSIQSFSYLQEFQTKDESNSFRENNILNTYCKQWIFSPDKSFFFATSQKHCISINISIINRGCWGWNKHFFFSWSKKKIFSKNWKQTFSTLYLVGFMNILVWASLMGLVWTKRVSGVLDYNPGTFDNYFLQNKSIAPPPPNPENQMVAAV